MSSVIPQDAALDLQLAACAGQEPAGSRLEIRHREPGGRMRRRFLPLAARADAAAAIRRLAQREDTYFGVAPRAREGGGTDSIERCWTLHADCDTPEARRTLEDFEPAAAVIVESGSGGAHGYWPLRRSLTPERAARANRRLAHHLGADMAAIDAARILRPAGTRNHKHDPPRPVTCVRLELLAYDARVVVGHLPDPPGRERPASSPPPIDPGVTALTGVPPEVYVRALTGREPDRDGKVTCPFHGGGRERTPSLHVYPDADRGWVCFGCGRGGTIIDFGAGIYGIEPRGPGYHELVRRLLGDLLGRAA